MRTTWFTGIIVLGMAGWACVLAEDAPKTPPNNGRIIAQLAGQMGQPLPESLQKTLKAVDTPTKSEAKPAEMAKTPIAPPAEKPAKKPEPIQDSQVVPASAEKPIEKPIEKPAEKPAEALADPFALEDVPAPAAPAAAEAAPAVEAAPTPEAAPVLEAAPAELPATLEAPTKDTGLTALTEEISLSELPPATAPAAAPATPAPTATTPAATPVAEPVAPVTAEELKPTEEIPAALPAPTDSSLPTMTDISTPAPTTSATETAVIGRGAPGAASLEGVQASMLTIQKQAPKEIQVGCPAVWTIVVRNEGQKDATGVQIHDAIPKGTKLIGTTPAASQSENGELTWNVGVMPAGTMATVKVELQPTEEGTIGSVATVSARTEASAKAVATRPMLTVETMGESQILLGSATELTIVVSNPGSGIARNVVLSEKVPPELQFAGGAELMYKVGDLRPGETRTTKLPLTAVRPGLLTNVIEAVAEPNLRIGSQFKMEVTAPSIDVQLEGPAKRFLDKEGTYKLILANNGTAPASNVELKVAVPSGMKFLRANNAGTFLAQSGLVVWRLKELPAKDSAMAEFTVSPNQIGTHSLKYEAVADTCVASRGEKSVAVEGIAALMFQVTDANDPIQVGEETSYTITVVNQGSKQAENVQVAVGIPAGLQIVSSEAATTGSTGEIAFAPITSLAPKAEKIFRFVVRGTQSGDQRLSVKLSSKEFPTPIVKEESTRVYSE